MNKLTKKKLRIVIIAFFILIIPIGYLFVISYAIKMHDDALKLAEIRYPDDKDVTKKAIITIDNAIRLYHRNYLFRMNKSKLLLKLGDYRGALNAARKGTNLNDQFAVGLQRQGLIYEYLNQPDSAGIYYLKTIEKLKQNCIKEPDNPFIKRQIALFYTFLGDSLNAKKNLEKIPVETSSFLKSNLEIIDFYIENYESGGLKDFLYGETIEMVNCSIPEEIIDSLILSERFYYQNYHAISDKNQDKKTIYEFRKIFKEKAKTIGFKELK